MVEELSVPSQWIGSFLSPHSALDSEGGGGSQVWWIQICLSILVYAAEVPHQTGPPLDGSHGYRDERSEDLMQARDWTCEESGGFAA
jgi:hypothetical protein